MRKFTYPLLGLALAATAAHAQETPDASAQPAGPETEAAPPAPPAEPAAPDSVPPADAAPADPAVPAPPSDAAAPPAPDASAAETASFTDEEVDQFAKATVKVQEIDADASIAADQKQSQMAAAVTEAGLDPATYNKIGRAVATDPELRTRVLAAMSRHQGGATPDTQG